jgi:hypothetical protein
MAADFVHAPGQHCATTAISLLLRTHGHKLSEPMILGLGAGLDFGYLVGERLTPTRYLFDRAAYLEADAFAALGIPTVVRQTANRDEAWSWVRNEIDAGRPALIQADIRWLDYYDTKTHFGGHKILVVGYDDERRTALISDNAYPELQQIPLTSLARARAETTTPWLLENDWFDLRMPAALTPPEIAVPRAIAAQAVRLLSDRGPILGLPAMERAAQEMPSWGEAADWKWCARFSYQVVEKRGTGGGAFRKMYAAFLREATPFCPDIARLGLAPQMAEIAARWTELAYVLKAISDRDAPGDSFTEAGSIMTELRRREQEYYEAAAACQCAALADGSPAS